MERVPDRRALFALLGVDEHASWTDVRRAFRDAVRATHPDLHVGDPDAEQRLKALNAAWETINTPAKWAALLREPASAATVRRGRTTHRSVAPLCGRLRIHRAQRGSAGLRHWKLELDGEVVTSIENGGMSVVDAAPGRHRLRVFYESVSSPPLDVDLHLGQELVLGCRQQDGVLVHLFSPKRSLLLELLSSRRLT